MARVPDPETMEKVNAILAAARTQGMDPALALDMYSLLVTPRRHTLIRAGVVAQVHELLETPVHRLLPEGSGNMAEDLRKALLEMVERWYANLEQENR